MTKSLFIAVVAFHATVTNAGFFSTITGIFGNKATAAEDSLDANSQKMPLLEAPLNPNVSAAQDDSSSIVDDNALVAETDAIGHASALETPKTTTISTYTVKTGDSISGIAAKFDISVDTILWANNLKRSSSIKVGQSLVILPITGVKYVVGKGDTIQSIAKKFKGDTTEILSYNNIDDNTSLKSGQVIVIPDGELPAVAAAQIKTKAKTSMSAQDIAKLAVGVKVASADDAGYYMRPIKGGTRTQGIHGNNGVDLADACGTSLYASAAGEVIIAKGDGAWNGGYGNYVVISHSNGSQTLYGHMQSVSVSEGSTVQQGAYIGQLGATGKVHGVTGCHVHFEIRNGPVNPF